MSRCLTDNLFQCAQIVLSLSHRVLVLQDVNCLHGDAAGKGEAWWPWQGRRGGGVLCSDQGTCSGVDMMISSALELIESLCIRLAVLNVILLAASSHPVHCGGPLFGPIRVSFLLGDDAKVWAFKEACGVRGGWV